MFIKRGDGKVISVITDEDIKEQAKKLANEVLDKDEKLKKDKK